MQRRGSPLVSADNRIRIERKRKLSIDRNFSVICCENRVDHWAFGPCLHQNILKLLKKRNKTLIKLGEHIDSLNITVIARIKANRSLVSLLSQG